MARFRFDEFPELRGRWLLRPGLTRPWLGAVPGWRGSGFGALDGVLLGAFLPIDAIFVVHVQVLKKWYFRRLLRYVPHLAGDSAGPLSINLICRLVETGKPVVIFPEGRLTIRLFLETARLGHVLEGLTNGSLPRGSERAAALHGPVVGPVYLVRSRLPNKGRRPDAAIVLFTSGSEGKPNGGWPDHNPCLMGRRTESASF